MKKKLKSGITAGPDALNPYAVEYLILEYDIVLMKYINLILK